MAPIDKRADLRRVGLAASLVAYATDQSPDHLFAANRGSATVSFARQVAMYLTYVRCEMSLARVAAVFGRDRSTVAHACHQIEDRRDDMGFDAWIEALEETLTMALQVPLPRAEEAFSVGRSDA